MPTGPVDLNMEPTPISGDSRSPERDVSKIVAAFRKAQATGEPVDPSYLDLQGLNFLGQDLSKLDLSGCNFTGAELSRCDLRDANCAGAIFDQATLFQAKLDGAEFLSASFQQANLSECSAKNTGFGQCNLEQANFSMSNLTGATFVSTKARRADFRNCKMAGARMMEADLHHADFSQSDMGEVDLQQTNLDGTTFSKTSLRGVRLRNARNYTTAHWIDADIRDVDFAGAYLVRRHIVDENFLHEFQNQSRTHRCIYWIWWVTSDCGRSALRWAGFCGVIIVIFGFIFDSMGDQVEYPEGLARGFAPWYFSAMLSCTSALGDVLPKSTLAQILVNTEVMIGYIGFGGLITIISSQMGTRGE